MKKYRTKHRPVGASLLTIAGSQATSMSNVLPSSRAGSLPHWFCVVHGICAQLTPRWRRIFRSRSSPA
ncbi:hypothetical protein EKG40_08545 [Pseudomonas moorei]|nr:hypothetical protein EKG40_08545 [Pseudomonas moorei]